LIDLTLRLKDYPSLLTSTSKEMHFKNPKIQRTVASLILISLFLPSLMFLSLPKQAEAAGIPVFDAVGNALEAIVKFLTATNTAANVTNTAFTVKNFLKEILREVLKTIAKRALAELTKSTVNWINSGFHGKPLFLENPDSFFKDITKFEIKRLVDTLGYSSSRYPYGRNWSLGIIGAYKRQIDYNAAYSLSLLNLNEAIDQANFETSLQNYRSNFNIGGWNGLTLHTQYPQNNVFGFQMGANEELARRIDVGPIPSNEIGKVQNLLQQGQGFLSPQVCRSNPSLVQNPYNPPTFKYDAEDPPVPADFRANMDVPDFDPRNYTLENGVLYDRAAYQLALTAYNSRKGIAQVSWTSQNTCTGGWANTTPGYVAASQITRALGSKFSQNELGQALGVSLSAIFDALLSKLFDTGLNALASKSNPEPENEDNWDYLGNTLGSPDDDPNRDIFSGPDQEIVLDEFKKQILGKTIISSADGSTTEKIGNGDDGRYVPGRSPASGEYVMGDIARTETELALMDNLQGSPGVMQVLAATWPNIRQLDMCLPGPNLGWEDRLDEERDRVGQQLQVKVNDSDGRTALLAATAYRNLKFAVDFYKDWAKKKMLLELPSAPTFLDAINGVRDFDQQATELRERLRRKIEALARLRAIAGRLYTITSQPSPGTQDEKELIDQKKQYDSIWYSISNVTTLEDTKAELNIAQERLGNVTDLLFSCSQERRAAGWNVLPNWGASDAPKGKTSILLNKIGQIYAKPVLGPHNDKTLLIWRNYIQTGQEIEQFCGLPVADGYTHDSFINPKDPTEGGQNVGYKDIPLINGADVFRFKTKKLLVFSSTNRVAIQLSCDNVYASTLLDYKGSIPSANIDLKDAPPEPTNEEGIPGDEGATEGKDTAPPPPPPQACDPNTDPNCVPPGGCGGAGQIACL